MTLKKKLAKQNSSKYVLFNLLPFTILFILLQFVVFYAFQLEGKSFVWDYDGINQHYPALHYYSQLLKDLFSGKGLKMIDFSIGMGFDTLTTLNYYVLGDPITLLAVFCNADNMEEMYRFLILLRLYLAGMGFTLYCYYMKKDNFPTVLGGLIYVFCGFVLYAGVRHPYFTNPMIYLPFLLIGVEQVMKKKKPYLFIFMVFLSSISNFYFFYMLTLIVVIYASIRFFCFYRNSDNSIYKEIWGITWKSVSYYLLGVMMAAFLLIPVLVAFFNNGRLDSGYCTNLIHYSKGYYVLMINSFLAANIRSGFWTMLTFAAIVTVGIMVIFRSKKHRELMICFVVSTIFLIIPVAGYLMNGLAYVCNRWEFGYSFLIAFIFVATYEEMFQLGKLDKILLLIGMSVYALLGFINPVKYIWIAIIFLCLTIAVVLLFNHYRQYPKLQKTCILVLVFSNLGVNGFLTYDSKNGDYVSEFTDKSKVQASIEKSAVSLVPHIKDDSFYRVETYGDTKQNEALTLDYNDVAGYYSITDNKVSEYMKDLELISQKTSFRFDNLDYRTILSTLASVKYLVTSNKSVAPYAYKLVRSEEKDGNSYYLFENQYALPIGYTYSQYISYEEYQKLNALEKQEIMLQAIVVEQTIDGVSQVSNNKYSSKELEVYYEPGKGISINGDTVRITKKGAYLRVLFEGVKEAETYLRLDNFHINDSVYYKINLKVTGEYGVKKSISVRSQKDSAYFGKEDYLINLGYRSEPMTYCDIIFNNKGIFHLSDLQVYALPMSKYTEQVNELKEYSMEDVIVENNCITGNVILEENGMLCLSIPYSTGWTAYVNGNKTKLLRANIMYMGLPLKAGNNDIELRYVTPFLKEGTIISCIGWGIFVLMIVLNWKGKKYKNE